MSSEQVATFQQFERLVHHAPFDVWIAVLGVAGLFGLIVLFVTRQKPPSPAYRAKWQLEEAPRDLWSKYFRGWWWVP